MTINTVITRNVYDMGSATPRLLTDGTYDYVWGPGGLAYLMDATKLAKSYATDGLGSVRALTDGTKATTDTATRDAFGNLTQSTGSTPQPFGFTGEVRDGETGFLYLSSRSYDPATGRFLTRDSLPSGNRYVYANDNPVRFTDPTGHLAESGDVADGGACVDAACGAYVRYSDATLDAVYNSGQYIPANDPVWNTLPTTPSGVASPSASGGGTGTPVDYEKISVNVGPVVVEHTVDRFGQAFYAVGAGWGFPQLGFSHVRGVMRDRPHSPRDTENFLTGPAITGQIGFLDFGHGVTYSPGANNSSNESGFYTPQVGLSATFGFAEANLQNWRPFPFFPD